MTESKSRIAVIGAGSWGSAIAILLATNNHQIDLYSHDPSVALEINTKRENPSYLPEAIFPENINAIPIKDYQNNYEIVVNVVPTQFVRNFYRENNINLSGKLLVNCSKGIDLQSHTTLHDVFVNELGVDEDKYSILTGPSHAEELYNKQPTTVVLASSSLEQATRIQNIFANEYFRVYTSSDIIGCELGGATKNVIAIASGITDGLSLGDNLKAAVLSRGLAEIMRLGKKIGGEESTFSGLSGLGDLAVTCYSKHSRNRKVGKLIASGKSLEQIQNENKFVAEGVYTSKALKDLADKLDVELPICEKINEILFDSKDPMEAVNDLMTRDYKQESWG